MTSGSGCEGFDDVKLTLPAGVQPPTRLKLPEIKRYEHLIKLILIGDQSVGKTNLTMKFCDYDYSPNYVATIGIDFKVKTVDVNGRFIKLQIWDTAGQERFQSISKMYFRGAHGVMFVYDVTYRPSFENVKRWISTYEEASGDSTSNMKIPKMLIGNKCDDFEERKVLEHEGETVAKSFLMTFVETSAKTGYNVDQAFKLLTEQVMVQIDKEIQASQPLKSKIKKKRRNHDSRKRNWSWSCSIL